MSSSHDAPRSFIAKKSRILASLSVPDDSYQDASPKGSIDEPIRDLIDEINAHPAYVTTSSCSGRVSVFLDGPGQRRTVEVDGQPARDLPEPEGAEEGVRKGASGKGGGQWLYVTHDEMDLVHLMKGGADLISALGMVPSDSTAVPSTALQIQEAVTQQQWIHLKFEPMILHVLAATLSDAQHILTAANQAGFRESGAQGLTSSSSQQRPEQVTPMVAIRSLGLGFESVVGYYDLVEQRAVCLLPEEQLRLLVAVANARFQENRLRIQRLKKALLAPSSSHMLESTSSWEDAASRKARKRAEGLERARRSKLEQFPTIEDAIDSPESMAAIASLLE